jgi:hypothetical protein
MSSNFYGSGSLPSLPLAERVLEMALARNVGGGGGGPVDYSSMHDFVPLNEELDDDLYGL